MHPILPDNHILKSAMLLLEGRHSGIVIRICVAGCTRLPHLDQRINDHQPRFGMLLQEVHYLTLKPIAQDLSFGRKRNVSGFTLANLQ